MRIDSAILEPLIVLAALSPNEAQVIRLWCAGVDSSVELGRQLGCKASTAAVHKCNAKKKIQRVQAAYVRAQMDRAAEEQDAEELSTPEGFYRFLLRALKPPQDNPGRSLIGLVWSDIQHGVEVKMALTGAAHAGALVTADDLLGRRVPRLTAKQNRERLARKGRAA